MKKRSRVYIIGFLILLVGVVAFNDFSEGEGRGNIWSTKAIKALEQLIDAAGNISLSNFTTGIPVSRVLYTDSDAKVASNPGLTFDGSTFTLKFPFTVGVDDTGYDVNFYGATSGKKFFWDESLDKAFTYGAHEIGDGTNYTLISSAGAVSYAGSAKPTECVFLSPSNAYLPDGSPVAATLVTVDGTSPHAVLDYSAAADNNAYWDFQVPTSYDAGNATVEVYWFSAAAVVGDAQFDIDYRSVGDSDAVDGAATDVAMTLQTTDGTAGDLNTTTGTLTTPFTAGDLVRLGLRRDISEEGGTPLVGNARVRGCKICWSSAS